MAEKKPVTKVPEGRSRYFKTRQMEPTANGFIGYETVWEPMQKEAPYTVPKRP